ncbi:MAG: hypothetical protein ACRCXM_08995 [Beijerinckiaceae bacterium]
MTDAAYKAGYAQIDWRPLPPVDKPVRQRPARSGFPCPMVISDGITDVQSMATGEWFDSKSALRRSYTADGNAQRRDYTELGDAPIEGAGRASVDKRGIRDAVDRAMHDVETGQIPDHIKAIE